MPLGMELAVSLNADTASVRVIVTTSTAAVFWAVKRVSLETYVSIVSEVFIMLISVYLIQNHGKPYNNYLHLQHYSQYGLDKCNLFNFLDKCVGFYSFTPSYIPLRTKVFVFCVHTGGCYIIQKIQRDLINLTLVYL